MTEGIDVYNEVREHLIRPSGKPHGEYPYPDSKGRIWSMCPVHPDGQKHGNRSLSLHPEYGLKCFAGCDYGSIKDALLGPIHSRNGSAPPREWIGALGKPVAVYEYSDQKGTLIAQKGRFNTDKGKTFRWRRSDNGPWSGLGDMTEADLPLYRADAIVNLKIGTPIYLVEGEKAADRLVREGIRIGARLRLCVRASARSYRAAMARQRCRRSDDDDQAALACHGRCQLRRVGRPDAISAGEGRCV